MSTPESSRVPVSLQQGAREARAPTALGTLGWVGAVLVGAVLALLLLSWLGPVGGR